MRLNTDRTRNEELLKLLSGQRERLIMSIFIIIIQIDSE